MIDVEIVHLSTGYRRSRGRAGCLYVEFYLKCDDVSCMPLMFLPPDPVLQALGKMTLWFAELEYYVNQCLLWLHQPQTEEEAKKFTNGEFNRRAKDLKDSLQARFDAGTLWRDSSMKPPIEFSPSLTALSDQRNLLTHGMAYTALDEKEKIGKTYKYSSRSKQKKQIDEPSAIEELTAKIEKAAEQAQWIAISLQLENEQSKP